MMSHNLKHYRIYISFVWWKSLKLKQMPHRPHGSWRKREQKILPLVNAVPSVDSSVDFDKGHNSCYVFCHQNCWSFFQLLAQLTQFIAIKTRENVSCQMLVEKNNYRREQQQQQQWVSVYHFSLRLKQPFAICLCAVKVRASDNAELTVSLVSLSNESGVVGGMAMCVCENAKVMSALKYEKMNRSWHDTPDRCGTSWKWFQCETFKKKLSVSLITECSGKTHLNSNWKAAWKKEINGTILIGHNTKKKTIKYLIANFFLATKQKKNFDSRNDKVFRQHTNIQFKAMQFKWCTLSNEHNVMN